MTNAERINQMSNADKAQWILKLQEDNCSCCVHYKTNKIQVCELDNPVEIDCIVGRIEWLEMEVDND